jgi:glycosyltransferase involved in cell wall biosynthesis
MNQTSDRLFGDNRVLSVAYIVRSYPRLSQTFILDEIRMLEQMGLNLRIFAVTDPQEPIVQSEVRDVLAPTVYLDLATRCSKARILTEQLIAAMGSPRRYARALYFAATHKDCDRGYAASTRYKCLVHAAYLARLLKREERRTGVGTDHLHAHFAHDPTLVALLAHILTGISYSFTAHARDLYQVPKPILIQRAEKASAIVTCCQANVDYLNQTLPARLRDKVKLIYHGKDLLAVPVRTRSDPPNEVPVILSVGRLVEKKGFGDLVHACYRLKQQGQPFTCVVYGEGPERPRLLELVDRLGMSEQISFPGARSRSEIVAAYLEADVFALTPFVTDNGDRDGIPNVLIEAMACGLPVITTYVGGIPELVKHDVNGLLSAPHCVAEIAAHLASLLHDDARHARLSLAARGTVEQYFDARTAGGQLAELFEGLIWGRSDLQPA